MKNKIYSGQEVLEELLKGAKLLANTVGVTLGPRGKNVIFRAGNRPISTKDGATVVKHVQSAHPVQQMGIDIIREAAQETCQNAGDGTTSATLLAYEILNYYDELVDPSEDGTDVIKEALEESRDILVANLKKLSKPVKNNKMLRHVATVSANNDKSIGRLIAGAFKEVGKDGILDVEKGTSSKDEIEIVKGLKTSLSLASPYFITNMRKAEAELENCFILMVDGKIDTFSEIAPIIEKAMKVKGSILIAATGFNPHVISTLALNKVEGNVNAAAIELPKDNLTIENVAAFSGAEILKVNLHDKLENTEFKSLGFCKKVTSSRYFTLFQEGKGDISDRVEVLKSLKGKRVELSLAALQGAIGVIRVGGNSPIEIQERMYRVEDALEATRAAVEEGVVLGGGTAYLDISSDRVHRIVDIALGAIQSRLRKNADGNINLDKDYLRRHGIYEPAKVIRNVIENAISVANTIITTEVVITSEPDDDVKQLFIREKL